MNDDCTVLIVGDPHFKTRQLNEASVLVTEILRVTEETKPDAIVILGDVLDRHETIHVSPLTLAINLFEQLAKITKTYVIIGNHDRKSNREFLTEEHPFVGMKHRNDIVIVDRTLVTTIKHKKVTFVPYVAPGRFIEALNTAGNEWYNSTTIFCHQEFKGCDLGGIISEEGDNIMLRFDDDEEIHSVIEVMNNVNEETQNVIQQHVNKQDYEEISKIQIISGHIHTHQIIGNIFYTGTPFQVNFGEKEDKGIYLFNLKDNSNVKIKLNVPIKRKVCLTPDTMSAFTMEDNILYKILITGLTSEMKGIQKHPLVLKWRKLKIPISYHHVVEKCSEDDVAPSQSCNSIVKFTDLLIHSFDDSKYKDDLLSMFRRVITS